jgi:hypothetical protein
MIREKQHEFDSLPWPEFHIQPGDLVRVHNINLLLDQQGLGMRVNRKNSTYMGNLYSHEVCVVLVVEDAHLFVLLHPRGVGGIMVGHGWEILKIS